ncbi:integrase [Romboutsia sp. MSSM.1001216sp_RTP31141st1_G3_RTP31141_220114]|uniref:integrase n=1 Tax=unclassified Romboutsia TaxID=2626894 RepID=UPI0031B57169
MEDKFKYILELQEQGLTRHEIKDKLGYKSIDSLTKFLKKRGYSFDNKLNRYTPIDDISMTNAIGEINKAKQQDIILNDDKGMTIDIQQDIKANIIKLANDYDKIQQVIKWFDNKIDDKSMTEVIEVINQGIKIDLPLSENTRTTIRINKEIWDRFEEFSKKNKEFNKQDLMAQALKEYMEKY